ncbi:MAG: tail fiber domain-containing protein [Verrucomicrobiales bacterium]|nr:tail fiber domain-containing protein [Verrucomicrobiales bacterium]
MNVPKAIPSLHRTLATCARIILACATTPLVGGPSAHAEPPPMISYQGRLSVSGVDFTGTGHFRFALVSLDGGESFWSHDGTSASGSAPGTAIDLPVVNGLYSVRLGDGSIPGMTAPVPASVFARTNDVRLRIWFDDDTHGVQQLAPDARLASVGYALVAGQLTGLISEGNIPVGGITARSLADQSVSSTKLTSGAVVAASIADGAVTSSKVADGSIGPKQIASGYGLWKQTGTGLSYDLGNVDIGVGGNRGTAPLHVTSGPAYINSVFESESPYGTWLTLGNTSAGGTNWILQAAASQSTKGSSPGFLTFSTSASRGTINPSRLALSPAGLVGINTPMPMAPLQVQSPSGGGDLVIVGGDNHTGALTSLSLGITARSGGRPYLQGVSLSGSYYGSLAINPDAGDVDVAPWGSVSLAAKGTGVGIGLGTNAPAAALQVDSHGSAVNTLLDGSSTSGTWLGLRNASGQGTNSWVMASSGSGTWQGLTPGSFVIGPSRSKDAITNVGLTLTPAGNMGVDMVKPSAPVHIGRRNSQGAALRIGGDPTVNSTAILDIGLTSDSNATPYIQGVSSSGNNYGVTIINPMGGRTQTGPSGIQDPTSSLFVHQDPSSSKCAAFSDVNGAYYITVGGGTYPLKVFGDAQKTDGGPFWATTSDERLKTEIETLGSALSLVHRIRPVTFRYSDAHRAANPGTPSTKQYGVVAQEFAKVFPDFVSTNQDGFLSVNSSPLVFANTAAIQELHTQVKNRDARIHQLESRVDELQQDVTRLKAARDSFAALTDQLQAMQKQLAEVARNASLRVVSNP